MTSNLLRVGTAVGAVVFLLLATLLVRREEPRNPLYIYDGADIQYFALGPEFKLTLEAAAVKAYQADLDTQLLGP